MTLQREVYDLDFSATDDQGKRVWHDANAEICECKACQKLYPMIDIFAAMGIKTVDVTPKLCEYCGDDSQQAANYTPDGPVLCSECTEIFKHADCQERPCPDCQSTLVDNSWDAFRESATPGEMDAFVRAMGD